MDKSIFSIKNIDNTVLGTGFVIDSDNNGVFVATCGHVVNNCGDSIVIEGVTPEVVKNTYKDGLDLAILYVKGLFQNSLPLKENKEAKVGKVIGFSKLLNDPKKEPISCSSSDLI